MQLLNKTKLIQCDLQPNIKGKWSAFVNGKNGFLYGIPYNATKVIEFNPENKSFKEIGPDLGVGGEKYWNGIMADNGSIYCVPYRGKYFLKITPMDGGDAEILILKHKEIPRGQNQFAFFDDNDELIHIDQKWIAGALAKDGCIYYMPYSANSILKLDPNNDDNLSLIGEDILEMCKMYAGAIAGNDGCIYGLPYTGVNQVIKFNPVENNISILGSVLERSKGFCGSDLRFRGCVLATDGKIYTANYAKILQIDTATHDFSIIWNKVYNGQVRWWGEPVLGADKCIYFCPNDHGQALKFNPQTQIISTMDWSFGEKCSKWYGAALASDGFIYCIPYNAEHVLQIDSRHINEQVLDIAQNHLNN